MDLDFSALKTNLTKKPKSVYLLYGDEEFLVEQALKTFVEAHVDEATRDFNYDVFYAKETPSATILDVLETLPMMAPRRLVVVKEIEKWNEGDWTSFDNYFSNPLETSTLLLVARQVDKRKKAFKKLFESSEVFEFKKLYDNQVPQWIERMVHQHSLQIERDAVSLLQQFVGNNLMDLQNEIQKLQLYIGARRHITVKDVIEVVSKIKVQSVFDLARSIGEGDKAKALLCLSQLLSQGQNEVGILALVARHIRILRMVKTGQKEGLRGAQLASRAGVSPYFLSEYEQQSRLWSDKKIERSFKALLDTDRALKSSPVSSHIWLENFIIQTCS